MRIMENLLITTKRIIEEYRIHEGHIVCVEFGVLPSTWKKFHRIKMINGSQIITFEDDSKQLRFDDVRYDKNIRGNTVISLKEKGFTHRDIATLLCISQSTVGRIIEDYSNRKWRYKKNENLSSQ